MSSSLEIPKAVTKRIMKINDEVELISAESLVATTKAAELFVQLLAQEAQQICVHNNRKTIKVDDVLLAIDSNQPKFAFLNEAFGVKPN